MARTVTATIDYPNGQPWASGLVTDELLTPFETADTVYPAHKVSYTLDANGQTTLTLATPDTGTAWHRISLPNGKAYEIYIDTGPAVDLVTLLTISGTAVAVDDLQTLMDAAEEWTITPVAAAYDVVASDQYLYCTGTTYTINLLALVIGTSTSLVIDNAASGNLTVDAAGGDTINGAATLTLYPGDRRVFVPVVAGVWRA